MYYITLFIQKNDIKAYIFDSTQQKLELLDAENNYFLKNNIQNNDIISTIITIKKKIENEIFFNDVKIKSDIQYRLILDDSLITKQKLTLPNIELSDYEIENQISSFIKKSLLNDEKYSYHYELEQQNFKNLVFTIFIYPVSLIYQYTDLFEEKNIKFFGYQENQINFADLSSEKFISTENIDGINFLPLRELKKNLKRKNTLKIAIFLIFLLLFITILLYLQIQRKKDAQEITLSTITKEIEKNNALLLSYKLINDHLFSLKKFELEQKQKQNRLLWISNNLRVITISEQIWLNKIFYKSNQISIQGNSFTHSAIIKFADKLLQQQNISYVKIISIQENNHQFLFDLLVTI